MDEIKNLTSEEITAALDEKRDALNSLFEVETPTDEQVAQAEELATDIRALEAEKAERAEAAGPSNAEKFASLKEEFSAEEDDAEGEEAAADDEIEAAEETEEEESVEAASEESEEDPNTVTASGTEKGVVKKLAARTKRPQAPESGPKPISITAAADVPDYSAGQKLEGMAAVADATINRAQGLPPFDPSRQVQSDTPELHKFPVASFRLDYPEELISKRGTDDYAIVTRAANEGRLKGKSLTAAGGWCAPSETIYDLCDGETTEGLVSIPEIQVDRGGINFTSGPDFSTLFADSGFCQTEAEAEAGTVKNCFEVACPPFTEIRLDVCGVCITTPILTEAAYPELVQRVLSGSMIAHQHRVSGNVIAKMVAASTAKTYAGLGATVTDTLEALELIASHKRQDYRLSLNATMEVIVPHWVKGAFRADLSRRNGIALEAVTDAQIQAHFASRNLNVQFVYNWQDLPDDDPGTTGVDESTSYPDTYDALVYPAGTFVKGVKDVINLSAVYDKASLEVNTYTGLFFEQGYLVAQTCFDSTVATLPVCNGGRQGILDLSCV